MAVIRSALYCLSVACALQAGVACAKEYACPVKNAKPVSVSLYDGPPSQMADLEPDNGDDANAKSSVWTLFDNPRGFWMVCSYAKPSDRFSERLDNPKKSCTTAMKDSATLGLNCE